ncbi:hypothetical protein QE422_000294 [Chryseobacterium sp. SORGH_AS 447]|nr:hypothetical protein [Chryseobacterium sp. SORGH_AS_0447]
MVVYTAYFKRQRQINLLREANVTFINQLADSPFVSFK